MSQNKINQEDLKYQVAQYALKYIADCAVVGMGTGSTVNCLIELLDSADHQIRQIVSTSQETTRRLRQLKKSSIDVVDLNSVGTLPVYVDGADEALRHGQLIKGRGGALTQEKIVAASSRLFVCMIDESKLSQKLGRVPVPVEVIPSARGLVARGVVALGGNPVYREGFITDNGNIILDVEYLDITVPLEMEQNINHIPGVICCGIFAARPADILLMGSAAGVQVLLGE